jgi:Small nuclear ribonucleoprotein (snRNP) homolog
MSTSTEINKKTKMSDLINFRLKISTIDNRNFIGTLLAFDRHLNLVLSDTEESRITKKSYQALKNNSGTTPTFDKRSLGLIILRGDQIVSLSIESPPLLDTKKRLGLEKGKGISKPLKMPVSVKGRVGLQGPAIKKSIQGFKRQ